MGFLQDLVYQGLRDKKYGLAEFCLAFDPVPEQVIFYEYIFPV
jgi:hypothetical protein